MSKVASFGQLT